MDYMSTREAALRWGVSIRNIQRLLADNRIPNAKKYGVSWMIPSDAKKPDDLRNERRKEKNVSIHLLPKNCPMFATTTIYKLPGSAEQVIDSLSNDWNAQELFDAQLQYFKGNYEEADKKSRKLLEQTKCFDTRLGCLHTISNAAMYKGDYLTWLDMYDKVMGTPVRTDSEIKMKELCIASTDSALYDCRTYPEWLKIGCFDDLPLECFPIMRYYFCKYLSITRASFGSIKVLEVLCSQTKAEGAVISELYQQLLMTIGYHDSGQIGYAAKHFNRALDLALPDKLYAPLAEARKNIGSMFDDILIIRDPQAFRSVCNLYSQLVPNWTSIYEKRMNRDFTSRLTVREHEIAKYASIGFKNDEIAEKLCISTGTVRTHISSILQKTGLKSRNELADYFMMSRELN